MISLGKGKVYLVGAGPGDPKLITVKGLEALQKADAVVYDRLASPRLLKHIKPGAEKIYVGKLPDRHTLTQDKINQLLVDLALEGKVVTRLKGGDPCVFGRVGEEAELLVDHGIEFEIVPGITSAVAVPAYAGIPVTHRDYNPAFSVITGHEQPEKLDSLIHWEKLSTATETLIFLMGVAKIQYISEQLMKFGKSPQTPVALIRWGTTAKQATLIGTLATIAKQVEDADFKPPSIILIGEVVQLREKLMWFEKKPLFGKKVLVTRSRSQASELADLIDEWGGEAVEFPVIEIQAPSNIQTLNTLDSALNNLSVYHWVLFTSVNGVEYFFRRLRHLNIDIRSMHQAVIAAVGPKTAQALEDRGLQVETLPSGYQAELLLESLLPRLTAGQKVLLPRADIARKYLPEALIELGLEVTEVDVYETVQTAEGAEEIIEQLQNKEINMITFTSSSTVQNLTAIIKQFHLDPAVLLQNIDIASIGPITTQTAEDLGLQVTHRAKEATIESLVSAMINQEVVT
jgi:uroporphyrinogen III methyltransferase/synthase